MPDPDVINWKDWENQFDVTFDEEGESLQVISVVKSTLCKEEPYFLIGMPEQQSFNDALEICDGFGGKMVTPMR